MTTLAARMAPIGRRTRVVLIVALFATATIAWAVTGLRMDDMGGGVDLGSLGFYVGVWVVMMAAMMFPSVWPMLVAYTVIAQRRRELGRSAPALGCATFLGGYLLSWLVFGLVAYGLIEGVRALDIEALSWDQAGSYLAGTVLVLTAAYQLTPMKDVCLRKCRTPMSFFFGIWSDGVGGALRMGVEHGAWCVGCCWGLMAALFALGIMSVGWMAFVAGLIAVEKLLPWKALANRSVAALLLVLGVAVVAAPDLVPGVGPSQTGSMGGGSSAIARCGATPIDPRTLMLSARSCRRQVLPHRRT
jgi:predicted metal-binding membrane protein